MGCAEDAAAFVTLTAAIGWLLLLLLLLLPATCCCYSSAMLAGERWGRKERGDGGRGWS
jgi:hypothetical protein